MELLDNGYDGAWSQLATFYRTGSAVEKVLLDPENREALRDENTIDTAAQKIGQSLQDHKDNLDARFTAITHQIGGRSSALVFGKNDLSRYMNVSDEERKILTPSKNTDITPFDTAAFLMDNAAPNIGLLHAFADKGAEARLMGEDFTDFHWQVYEMLHNAQNSAAMDLLNCSEPAQQCLQVIDNIDREGYAVVDLLNYRSFEERAAKVAESSQATRVALTGSDALPYQAYSRRFQSVLAERGFIVNGTKAPENSAQTQELATIEADELIDVEDHHEDTFRTRLGVVAYLLATNSGDIDHEWFSTYRPVAMEALSEEQAKRAFDEFMRLQHQGYTEQQYAGRSENVYDIRYDYQNRMRKLCNAWLPSVMQLAA